MLRLALLILIPAFLLGAMTRRRTAIALTMAGGFLTWIAISRFAYHSPIPLNEPEWWGGLAIVLGLAGIGLAAGLLWAREGRAFRRH